MEGPRGRPRGGAIHREACLSMRSTSIQNGLESIALSRGSVVLVVVTAEPTRMLCNSQITGKRQSKCPAKAGAFRPARNTLSSVQAPAKPLQNRV